MTKVDNDLEITLAQRITRADGTVEDLGVVASTADGSITVDPALSSRWQRLLLALRSPIRKDPR